MARPRRHTEGQLRKRVCGSALRGACYWPPNTLATQPSAHSEERPVGRHMAAGGGGDKGGEGQGYVRGKEGAGVSEGVSEGERKAGLGEEEGESGRGLGVWKG